MRWGKARHRQGVGPHRSDNHRYRHGGNADGGPEREPPEQTCANCGIGQPDLSDGRVNTDSEQRCDGHHVGCHGCPGSGKKLAVCVECSGGERIEAVEKYLHEKHASERGANVTKRGYVTRWAE